MSERRTVKSDSNKSKGQASVNHGGMRDKETETKNEKTEKSKKDKKK